MFFKVKQHIVNAFLRHKNTEHSPKKAVLLCITIKFTHFCKLV